MRTIHLFLAVSILSTLTTALAVWTCVRVVAENRRLAEESERLRREVALQAIQVRRLIADAEIERVERARPTAEPAPEVTDRTGTVENGPNAPLKAGRVRIVSGDRSYGGGWLVPAAAMPGASESLVLLDEGVRQALAGGARTEPPREVYRETTYYQSYPYYVGGYPFYYSGVVCPPSGGSTNIPPIPPTGPTPPPKVLLPETGGKPFLNTQYFQPGKPFVPSTPSKVFAAQAQAGAGAVRNQVGNAAPARRTTLAGR